MTQREAIEAAKSGERVKGECSLKDAETADPHCRHSWRVIFCDSDEDVVECANCGRQRVVRCNFDYDYA
jgi:hypothetical protein